MVITGVHYCPSVSQDVMTITFYNCSEIIIPKSSDAQYFVMECFLYSSLKMKANVKQSNRITQIF